MGANCIPKRLTIKRLKEMYGNGDIAPADVIGEILRRVKDDADMNIWIAPPSMEQIAPYLERLRELDPERLPLWGIPFAVKDNIDVAGMPTTAACPAYARTPERHAAVVERLIAAGAIPLGKTNMDQFAAGLVGTRSPYGETHNALRQELISGGSSSGSAVAVARGHAAFALGTDTAGSGRVPAALNGIVGWKPSVGAWPVRGVVPACASLDCVTVFAHDVEDAVAVDAVARGEDALDPWSRSIGRTPAERPEKLYLPKAPLEFYGPFAAPYQAAWDKTVEKLRLLAVPLETIDIEMFREAAAMLYEGPWIAERWAALGSFIEAHPGAVFPVTEKVLRPGENPLLRASDVFAAFHRLQELKHAAKRMLQDGVLVLPTCGGTWTRGQVRDDPVSTNSAMGRYTNHCNLLDLCAVSVPSVPAGPDLPFGITFFALAGKEGMIETAARLFRERISSTLVAVCGLHMRGFPLEQQMREHGATFVREDKTAPKYRMVKLPTAPPAKPGLIKTAEGGSSLPLEIWEMPLSAFGAFVAGIPSPLGIGKIELADGTEVPGFLCEGYAAADSNAEDVTELGGWRNVQMADEA
jgi:allophanate hydrolase